MDLNSWYMFATVSFLTIISPGPAILLAINNGLMHNMRGGYISSFANILGLFCLSSVSMLGLGAILQTSSTLFLIMKVLGASYLIYMGIKQFRNLANVFDSNNGVKIEKNNWKVFRKGFLVSVTNPKPIVFFTAIFPIFLNPSAALLPQFFTMTLTFMFFSFATLMSFAYFAKYFKFWFSNEKRARIFNRISGSIFVMLGLGLLRVENKTQ
ncbi:MAG TPA: LysE family translocator [Sulfurospirillum arcachonense]|nr:LysE family translocator [Sulfurospirillum arcachonense]HIP43931.1 LysE family translocator [Sulfurospirillum arcachonense]